MKKLSPDFMGFSFEKPRNTILKVLQYSMNDTSGWIHYWIYELNYGRSAKTGTVTLKSRNIPIKTIDDLYTILTKKKY
jgi:hypothetical protein